MPWVPILAAAGGLCLAFALVEWLLSRLDNGDEKRGRITGFTLAGCLCLVALGVVFRFPQAASATSPANAAGARNAMAQLSQQLAGELELIRQTAAGKVEPALNPILAGRRQLFEARMALAANPTLQSPELYALRGRADTLLSVAYNTLGMEWMVAKDGRWNNPADRTAATDQLRRELAEWESLSNCLEQGRARCLSTHTPSEKEKAMRDLTVWLHPYMVELARFQETDPDLITSNSGEIARLQALFRQARSELQNQSPGRWPPEVVKAADALFQSADQALSTEAAAVQQGAWHTEAQIKAYTPIRKAFDTMFQAMLAVRR